MFIIIIIIIYSACIKNSFSYTYPSDYVLVSVVYLLYMHFHFDVHLYDDYMVIEVFDAYA